MATPLQYDADRNDGLNIACASGQEASFAAQLRKTLNTIPAYAWYALPSGTLTFVNHTYADYLGLPEDDPLRLGVETSVPWDTHIQLVHPDDHQETMKVGETCNRTGVAGQATFRIRNSQGEYRWFLSRLEPLRAPDGTLLYWIGINLEIEELKRAEEQLRQSTQELKRSEFYLTEGQRLAHMGSWAFKAAGFDHWSAELFQIHGLDPRGKPPTVEEYLDTVHPEDREFMRQAIERQSATLRLTNNGAWSDRFSGERAFGDTFERFRSPT